MIFALRAAEQVRYTWSVGNGLTPFPARSLLLLRRLAAVSLLRRHFCVLI